MCIIVYMHRPLAGLAGQKNGEAAGTAGLAKRLEGIQIVLVPKNGKAPAMRYQGITSVKTQAYIKKNKSGEISTIKS